MFRVLWRWDDKLLINNVSEEKIHWLSTHYGFQLILIAKPMTSPDTKRLKNILHENDTIFVLTMQPNLSSDVSQNISYI